MNTKRLWRLQKLWKKFFLKKISFWFYHYFDSTLMHVFGIFFRYFTFFWDKQHKLQGVIFSRILKMAESATATLVMWPKNMEYTIQFLWLWTIWLLGKNMFYQKCTNLQLFLPNMYWSDSLDLFIKNKPQICELLGGRILCENKCIQSIKPMNQIVI